MCTQKTYLIRGSGTAQAKGSEKLGGRWDATSTDHLLSSLKPYRRELRVRVVPRFVWEKSSQTLEALGYIYNPEQIAKKMRNLKQDFRNAKLGKRKDGKDWVYFKNMELLYDKPLENDSGQCATVVNDVGSYDSYLNSNITSN
ncbi:Trihelix transcription factor PTL [Frankliniella fusca]|uniref:Trihelix transcription factor PTL n=1 Tax=Frankliniella fusca TaxID=407009 RepID=A0AAE1HAQ4_9NEOP|nr:Trihelix transcription factor PTL [Frankliniella fusca]